MMGREIFGTAEEGNAYRSPSPTRLLSFRQRQTGVPGRFEIDTGSSTALVLQRGFVERHGLEARHPDGLRMKVGGVGGVFETVATRLDRFDLATSEIERPVVEFPSRGEGGIPVARIDGSVGYQILRQFVITFDYSRREIWFERSAAFGESTIEWKTGFQAVKMGDNGFRVVTVQPNTPAAAAGWRRGLNHHGRRPNCRLRGATRVWRPHAAVPTELSFGSTSIVSVSRDCRSREQLFEGHRLVLFGSQFSSIMLDIETTNGPVHDASVMLQV